MGYKFVIPILLIFCSCSCVDNSATTSRKKRIHNHQYWLNSTVQTISTYNEKERSMGSAVVISTNVLPSNPPLIVHHALTAKHNLRRQIFPNQLAKFLKRPVFIKPQKIEIIQRFTHLDVIIKSIATVVQIDDNADIALIQFTSSFRSGTIKIANKQEIGEKIYAAGYPLGGSVPTIVDGYYRGNIKISGRGDGLFSMSIPVINGMSGGPIINESGQLIGITTGVVQTYQEQSIGTKSTRLDNIVKQYIIIHSK